MVDTNLPIIDGASATKYLKQWGAGTDISPNIPVHAIDQTTEGTTNGVSVKQGAISFYKALTVTNGAYSIGDVVGGLITITNATRTNAGYSIVKSIKLFGVTAIAFELWLFNADLATPTQADNAVFTLAAGDGIKCLAMIPIVAGSSAGTSFSLSNTGLIDKIIKADTASKTIYGYMKATAATSPGTTAMGLWIDMLYLD